MTNFRAGESGKAVVLVLVLINLALVGVIVWLLMKPGLEVLAPSGGKTDYLLAVNNQDQPRIYTPDGVPWVLCKKGECDDLPSDISCESANQDGFILVNFSRSVAGIRPANKAATLLDLIIPAAIAQGPVKDQICPRIGWMNFAGALMPYYPPTSVDPDCPPKSK